MRPRLDAGEMRGFADTAAHNLLTKDQAKEAGGMGIATIHAQT
jgi:hypothetical protein